MNSALVISFLYLINYVVTCVFLIIKGQGWNLLSSGEMTVSVTFLKVIIK